MGTFSKYVLIISFMFLGASCTVLPLEQSIKGRSDFSPVGNYQGPSTKDALDISSIKVLVWNVGKNDTAIVGEMFQGLSQGKNLILLQEVYLNEAVEAYLIGLQKKNWYVGLSWSYLGSGIQNGVVTISDADPLHVRLLRSSEPIIRAPKSSLLTYYRLQGSDETLLVANVHAINFCFTGSFQSQMQYLKGQISAHKGPMIVAGDFNTWSRGRLQSLREIMGSKELALRAVAFDSDNRTKRGWVFWHNGYPLDHIFYRGLKVRNSSVRELGSTAYAASDHNPMIVEFFLK